MLSIVNLAELPEEILDLIILQLDVPSLPALASSCHLLNRVANSEWVWQQRSLKDFNLPASIHRFRSRGWKKLYRGLVDPIMLTWGCSADNRLGREAANWREEQVPLPVQLRNVMQVACGGWSIHALTRQGEVWSCGSLNGEWGPERPRLVSSLHPHRIIAISAGRGHVMALTKEGRVFYWCKEDVVKVLVGVSNDSETSVRQIVGGWNHCVALINNAIWIWSPYRHQAHLTKIERQDSYVMVAAGAEFTIALTRSGHIHQFDMTGLLIRTFHDHVYAHITASHQMLAGFTKDGVVSVFHADGTPNPQPALQNKGACQMSFGDWHYGMLTEAGQIWTWGAYSDGALGHQESPEPQVIPLDKFVFQIGFAGWHCAALAINVEN